MQANTVAKSTASTIFFINMSQMGISVKRYSLISRIITINTQIIVNYGYNLLGIIQIVIGPNFV
uniref:Uncharacterized protein n=1 Tax=Meloidogyne incognita TaxID=6306 RepID=A0A914KN41_MELIC